MNSLTVTDSTIHCLDQCAAYADAFGRLQAGLKHNRGLQAGEHPIGVHDLLQEVSKSAGSLYRIADEEQIADAIKLVYANHATYSPDVAQNNIATLAYIFKREKMLVGALYEGGLECLKSVRRMPEVSELYQAVNLKQRKLLEEKELIETIQQS
ncbi:hypothetical protein PsAD13_03197 [Pseudovibrio sp. Ad13]|uniref:hypothetical protein n=1 Tax=Pseudovibrio sp. Ad13 TaxID=989396 RepID=UPI0007B2D2CD|nr:hypothetical protein [Pseudovibrio sp. Ad13]KZK82995.1 hypothetical protein PsAD13_03197 [Pseudovibrio sp. Ad13]